MAKMRQRPARRRSHKISPRHPGTHPGTPRLTQARAPRRPARTQVGRNADGLRRARPSRLGNEPRLGHNAPFDLRYPRWKHRLILATAEDDIPMHLTSSMFIRRSFSSAIGHFFR